MVVACFIFLLSRSSYAVVSGLVHAAELLAKKCCDLSKIKSMRGTSRGLRTQANRMLCDFGKIKNPGKPGFFIAR